jgi:hypothetical protein
MRSSTIKGTKTKQSIRSSTINDLPLLLALPRNVINILHNASCSGIEERITQLDLATWKMYHLPD